MSSRPDALPRRRAAQADGWRRRCLMLVLLVGAGVGAVAQTRYPGIGRPATAAELAAWDIDVRPDFKGLPKGAGSVDQGQVVWEARCASCHGVFGENNQVFSPLAGGTTHDDIRTGRVARLDDPSFPARTTLMKLATVSTLWDYINRAMPWDRPKSLSHDEVYAVTAYLLNLGGIVPDGFILSDGNIAEVQQRLPNRNGMRTNHGLWPGKAMGNGGKPDVTSSACMKDCAAAPSLAASMPDFARNQHGNLAEQQRLVGPQRGADTSVPPAPSLAAAAATAKQAALRQNPTAGRDTAQALLQKYTCGACHGTESRIIGPGFREIAARYRGRSDAESYLAGRITAGGQGLWGTVTMPAQSLPEADARAIAQWLAAGARQ